jgi:hypothetical protein
MATLTVTIKEDVLLNGAQRGSENVVDIASIAEIYSRIVDIGTASDTEVLKFDTADGAGTITRSKLKYLRFTNLSTTSANTITLSFEDTDSDQYFVKLSAGQSFILTNTDIEANDANPSIAIGAFSGALDLIMAKAAAGTPQLEVFAAMS